jgi:two-component system, chemotaxis family, sensor kinase Cph1
MQMRRAKRSQERLRCNAAAEEALEITPTSLTLRLSGFSSLLQGLIKEVNLSLDDNMGRATHDPQPVIVADESQMVELIQNPIGNGLKFHVQESPIVYLRSARRKKMDFSFKDDGTGIDPLHYAKLFIVFQRLHPRDYPGTGMALPYPIRSSNVMDGASGWTQHLGKDLPFIFSFRIGMDLQRTGQ